jgi:hypothetical protein
MIAVPNKNPSVIFTVPPPVYPDMVVDKTPGSKFERASQYIKLTA